MKILVSGATGLVGRRVVQSASADGDACVALTRNPRGPEDIAWDPNHGELVADALEGFDAVVHLAGENIASGRWTEEKKRRIRDSRVAGTELLCRGLARLSSKPSVLVAASAIGYYGDRGDESLDENSVPGDGFLADVCRDWEAATGPALDAGIRVVNTRIGVVLSRNGGALERMLTPFRWGVGGVIGDGHQYMSWVSIRDVVGAIRFALQTDSLAGPVNVVAPNPVTNREFTKTLGSVLHRPTVFPVPEFLAKLAMGQMAEDLLLASTRVYPKRLEANQYDFQHADLKSTLRDLLAE